MTPMGPSDITTVKKWADAPLPGALPKDLDETKGKVVAQEILKESTIDKNTVHFVTGKASTDKVVFHNGLNGAVQLVMDTPPSVPGLKVDLEKPVVMGHQDAVLTFTYEPPPSAPAPAAKQAANMIVKVEVQPLGQLIQVAVKFDDPAPAPK